MEQKIITCYFKNCIHNDNKRNQCTNSVNVFICFSEHGEPTCGAYESKTKTNSRLLNRMPPPTIK